MPDVIAMMHRQLEEHAPTLMQVVGAGVMVVGDAQQAVPVCVACADERVVHATRVLHDCEDWPPDVRHQLWAGNHVRSLLII